MTNIKYKLYSVDGSLTIPCPKLSNRVTHLLQTGASNELVYELSKLIFPERKNNLPQVRTACSSDDASANGLLEVLIATDMGFVV
ncbi:hypothetical protein [Vibrio cyclitrophicus]|uniref:hypothetical protein n=1 Tax=Vibrio cyclitrophicus TaxID=47951 RepID=UPI00029A5624|nr:hypothetical protein [Vibrio cyclitrophicus]OEE21878.1 hypothetical protein OAM_21880 [Vibrio cyclitrophicus ZF14]